MAECVRALMPLNEKYTADPDFESRLVDRILSKEQRMCYLNMEFCFVVIILYKVKSLRLWCSWLSS